MALITPHSGLGARGGMCLPLGEVLMEPLQLFVGLRLAAAGDLDFHRPVNPKYSWGSEFEPFELQAGGPAVHSGHGNI